MTRRASQNWIYSGAVDGSAAVPPRNAAATSSAWAPQHVKGRWIKLRHSYDRVRSLKDDIVYWRAYGFGAKPPYRDRAAYDDIIQASAGLARRARLRPCRQPAPQGIPHRKAFRTANGHMCILPYSDRNWRDFSNSSVAPELKDDAPLFPPTERIAPSKYFTR